MAADKEPPHYPFPIDQERSARGGKIYAQYCASCHGRNGRDFTGEYVGDVVPIAEIGTDRYRLDSYTAELAAAQNTLYAGYPWRFSHFRKTYGYANMPLDGVWLRAPYLHNGSVPTLRDLLNPSAERPAVFFRGYDVFDQKKVGFVSESARFDEDGRSKMIPQSAPLFRFDTQARAEGLDAAGAQRRQLEHRPRRPAYGTRSRPRRKTRSWNSENFLITARSDEPMNLSPKN